jgi:hypothetical protein
MNNCLTLTNEEWEIVQDLLERERRELPSEVRHTDKRDYRHKLEARLDMVESMIKRIEFALAKEPAG